MWDIHFAFIEEWGRLSVWLGAADPKGNQKEEIFWDAKDRERLKTILDRNKAKGII